MRNDVGSKSFVVPINQNCIGYPRYAFGGFDGENPLSAVERYGPLAGRWEALPPMNTQRCGAAVAPVMDKFMS